MSITETNQFLGIITICYESHAKYIYSLCKENTVLNAEVGDIGSNQLALNHKKLNLLV
jgi:hypothetical protein